MKKIVCSILFCVSLQSIAEVDSDFVNAIRHGAMAKGSLRVLDAVGIPVTNTNVHVWFSSYGRPQDNADWYVATDTNGVITVSHRTNEDLSWLVRKEGYYETHGRIQFRDRKKDSPKVKDGEWQPYGETRTVVLKRIKNPIEINRHSKCGGLKIPDYNTWIGFDFERYSFVRPYGDGEVSDVLLRFSMDDSPVRGYYSQMEVSFTNSPYAGAYRSKRDEKSEFQFSYSAKTNEQYNSVYVFRYEHGLSMPPVELKLPKDEYLIFRTRTELDDEGNLKSAHYGRLGAWDFVGPAGVVISNLAFNPTPNDTNLEDAETARRSLKRRSHQLEREQSKRTAGVTK